MEPWILTRHRSTTTYVTAVRMKPSPTPWVDFPPYLGLELQRGECAFCSVSARICLRSRYLVIEASA